MNSMRSPNGGRNAYWSYRTPYTNGLRVINLSKPDRASYITSFRSNHCLWNGLGSGDGRTYHLRTTYKVAVES